MPDVRIQVLGASGTELTAAFYFDVPGGQQLTGANDQTRVPTARADGGASALSAADLQGLKDGTVTEFVRTYGVDGLGTSAIAATLVSIWSDPVFQQEVLARYIDLYQHKQHIGASYDGTVWTP